MRIDVLGVKFDNLTMEEAAARALELMEQRQSAYVVTPNPEIVWMCRKNTALKAAVDAADLVVPDGIGVIYGAEILARPLKQRLPGIDLADRVFAIMAERGLSVYLLGAKPGVAEKAGEAIAAAHPGIKICGTADGYFKENEPVIEKINAAAPDLLLVCLGAPKQEIWMYENRSRLKTGLMMGLGGVLDVYAGAVQRAPESWQKLGLEWLYRLIRQPARIKRMIKLPAFLFAAVWQRISGKNSL